MKITNKNIDAGTPFDWGRTSLDYAKFRDNAMAALLQSFVLAAAI